jgi:hypothetical protein
VESAPDMLNSMVRARNRVHQPPPARNRCRGVVIWSVSSA